ncbi:MAG: hypothetical protein WC570_03575 [Patescibacteria group bacterium]
MQQKTCRQCGLQFEVTDEELNLLDKISPEIAGKKYLIPASNNCPSCRERSRMAWRNERALYKAKCYLCGQEKILIYSPDKNLKACCNDCFWSDKWDGLDQGRDYDPKRSFFEQMGELLQDSVLWGFLGANNENSDYCNAETNSKNCYLNFGGRGNVDSYYNTYSVSGRDNIDNYGVTDCESVYECVNCTNCSSSRFMQNCENCRSCHYCQDCIGCSDCFGCVGLRHKQYYFFNQQLGSEEYKKRLDEYIYTRAGHKRAESETISHFLKYPRRFAMINNSDDCTGDILINCKNVHNGFVCTSTEDSCNVNVVLEGHDLMDIFSFGGGELNYNVSSSGSSLGQQLSRSMSVFGSISSSNLYYCIHGISSQNLFGCVGLKKKQYCILNKQYSREEYEILVPQIIEKMMADGQWGDFFPMQMVPFGYNETIANDYYPLTAEEAEKKGLKWQPDIESIKTVGDYYVPLADIRQYDPTFAKATAGEAKEEIEKCLNGIIKCEVSEKLFKITPHELRQYIKMGIPVPTKHPEVRHKERFARMNPRHLWQRRCMCEGKGSSDKDQGSSNVCGHEGRCQKEFETTYAPDRKEKVYCDGCYQKSIL